MMNTTQDDIALNPLYFGDDTQQRQVIDTLSSALQKNKGGIYLIIGGQRTGKSSAIEQVELGLKRDKSYLRLSLQSIKAYFSADFLNELKQAIALSKRPSHRQFDGETLRLYKSNSSDPHEIVFIEEGFILPNDEMAVRKILDAHRKLRSKEPLSIVIDSPNKNALLMPGVHTVAQERAARGTQESIARLVKDYSELQVLRMGYNKQQIKEELWNLGNDYTVKAVSECLRDTFNVDVKHPAIVDVCKALTEKSREKYDIAFERIPTVEVQV